MSDTAIIGALQGGFLKTRHQSLSSTNWRRSAILAALTDASDFSFDECTVCDATDSNAPRTCLMFSNGECKQQARALLLRLRPLQARAQII